MEANLCNSGWVIVNDYGKFMLNIIYFEEYTRVELRTVYFRDIIYSDYICKSYRPTDICETRISLIMLSFMKIMHVMSDKDFKEFHKKLSRMVDLMFS